MAATTAGLALAASLVFAPGVGASDLTLPTDTVIYADEGSLIELGRVPVDTSQAGPLCTWEASVTNQNSTHPGNDVIVRSGDSELLLADVEATEGKVTTNSGSVYLADEVVVTLRMGPDGVFSGGLDLTIRYDTCTHPEATTTTELVEIEPAGPTTELPTTVPTTTAAPTTAPATTVPPTTLVPAAAPPTTAVEIAPAGPVLPVTGSQSTLPLVAGGGGMILFGSAGLVAARRRQG